MLQLTVFDLPIEMSTCEQQLSIALHLLSSRKEISCVLVYEVFNTLARGVKVAVVDAAGVSQATAF
jgi:hypothetical protein